MSPRDLARVLAAGRIAIGAGLLAAPRTVIGMWIGVPATGRAVAPVGRALGVREVVLGGMLLHTLDRPEVGRRWLRTLAACDGVDLAATLAARRSLPRTSVLVVLLAAAGTAGQLWAARELTAAEPAAGPAQ